MVRVLVGVSLPVEQKLLGYPRRGPGNAVCPDREGERGSRGEGSERRVPAFHAETGYFCVCTALLPDVDVAWGDGSALLGVEATCDHGDDAAGDGVEYLESVARRADADVLEGGLLHRGVCKGSERARETCFGRRWIFMRSGRSAGRLKTVPGAKVKKGIPESEDEMLPVRVYIGLLPAWPTSPENRAQVWHAGCHPVCAPKQTGYKRVT
jgi:hypothetical protein